MSYSLEKFGTAVRVLAAGIGPIQERLRDAYLSSLSHVRANELPDDCQAEFIALREELTEVAAKGEEGTVQATTALIGDERASELATTIVDLEYRIRVAG